jgi:exosortase A-associated hydrolase 2
VIKYDKHLKAKPFFLRSTAGEIFAIYFPAQTTLAVKKDAIFIPPFTDEMNKSRRSAVLLARALARHGVGTLIIDLYGTGDSNGEFVNARWDIWQQDIKCAAQWLQQQGNEILNLVGLRMGALLAMDCIEHLDATIEKVVLWQPIISGKSMMTQFLRLRSTASAMISGKKESVQDLRNLLEQGHSIEVAGYELAPELVKALDEVNLKPSGLDKSFTIQWLELVYGAELPPASKKLVESWKDQGVNISAHAISADPFWMGQNITVVTDLLNMTAHLFEIGVPLG